MAPNQDLRAVDPKVGASAKSVPEKNEDQDGNDDVEDPLRIAPDRHPEIDLNRQRDPGLKRDITAVEGVEQIAFALSETRRRRNGKGHRQYRKCQKRAREQCQARQ